LKGKENSANTIGTVNTDITSVINGIYNEALPQEITQSQIRAHYQVYIEKTQLLNKLIPKVNKSPSFYKSFYLGKEDKALMLQEIL